MTLPEYFDFEEFFCSLFYFFVGDEEKDVVDGCGDEAEEDHDECECVETLEKVDEGNKVLEEKKGLCHGIEYVLWVDGYLYFMLVFTVKLFFKFSLLSS